jgi:hypothetical protein
MIDELHHDELHHIEDPPDNGWLVLCIATGTYLIARGTHESLVRVLTSVLNDAEGWSQKYECERPPIQVYELGREMDWMLAYYLRELKPKEKRDV